MALKLRDAYEPEPEDDLSEDELTTDFHVEESTETVHVSETRTPTVHMSEKPDIEPEPKPMSVKPDNVRIISQSEISSNNVRKISHEHCGVSLTSNPVGNLSVDCLEHGFLGCIANSDDAIEREMANAIFNVHLKEAV